MNIPLIGVLGAMLLNFLLLFGRNATWIRNIYKWYFCSAIFLIGFILFFFFNSHHLKDSDFASWALMTPFLFSLIDFGFQKLSESINNRDYYLWLRGSSQLWNRDFKFQTSDRLISMFMLFLIFVLVFMPVIIHKDF